MSVGSQHYKGQVVLVTRIGWLDHLMFCKSIIVQCKGYHETAAVFLFPSFAFRLQRPNLTRVTEDISTDVP